jgi:3-oxoacyl-[acyl-carrier protein] reductase
MANVSFDRRVAIVTGGARGIGAVVTERLASNGLAVVVNYSGSEEPARDLVKKIQAAGGVAVAFKADVSDPGAVASLFDASEDQYGGVDVLVNNAGVMKLARIAESDDDLFDTQVAVNLKGVFNCLREAGKRLRDGGRIVNFSTTNVLRTPPTYAVYVATKAGVEALTRVMAKEMGLRRITVNAVAPGPTDTPLFTEGKSEDEIAAIAKMIPFGRLGEPIDVANVVSFLVGPDGGWVNGQVLPVNGGLA